MGFLSTRKAIPVVIFILFLMAVIGISTYVIIGYNTSYETVEKIFCDMDSECEGINEVCHQETRRCICKEGYLSGGRLGCLPLRQQGEPCDYSIQCLGVRQECREHTKTCECAIDYTYIAGKCRKTCTVSCNDHTCITSQQLCDGKADCQYGEDEHANICDTCQFDCDRGTKCVTGKMHCNGIVECQDGADEAKCDPLCESHCQDGTCILLSDMCNGVPDCNEGEDEKGDECNRECAITCEEGVKCINLNRMCDGFMDCADGYDEGMATCGVPCGGPCPDGYCVPIDKVCDDVYDCVDGTDEVGCVNEACEYECVNGNCITEARVCDGEFDCIHGEDEDCDEDGKYEGNLLTKVEE